MKILSNENLCTACTACKHACPVQAITMKRKPDGFLYPHINENICVGCGKCKKVCPIENIPVLYEGSECLAAYNKNEGQRLKSTSGGVFYLLAQQILREEGIVFGAAYNSENKVVHQKVVSIDDISALQGAKYVQSELNDTFLDAERALKAGKDVLFSGTPCQIAGLKKYLEKDYEKLLTVDLVCHGVPSPLAWESYLEYRKDKDNQEKIADKINVRSKETGWSRYSYSVQYSYNDGYVYQKPSGQDPYMRAFVSNMTLRPSCNECHFKGLKRCSDFTLGDFWGIWNIKPEMDDNKGTSLVVIHSEKGKEYWEKIKSYCESVSVSEEESYRENSSMMKASPIHPDRDEILQKLNEQSFSIVEERLPEIKEWKRFSLLKRAIRKIKKRM